MWALKIRLWRVWLLWMNLLYAYTKWSDPFFFGRYQLFQESVVGHYSSSVRMRKFAHEEMVSPRSCKAEASHWFYDQYQGSF